MGGNGKVYLCKDAHNEKFAIKIMNLGEECFEALGNFYSKLTQLNHPGIV